MKDLALAILGRNAEKQVQAALKCSEAQAHRIIQHNHCPSHLRLALVEFLEGACTFAEGRLGAAKDELKSIRTTEMLDRAQDRRLAAGRADAQASLGFGERSKKPSVK